MFLLSNSGRVKKAAVSTISPKFFPVITILDVGKLTHILSDFVNVTQ